MDNGHLVWTSTNFPQTLRLPTIARDIRPLEGNDVMYGAWELVGETAVGRHFRDNGGIVVSDFISCYLFAIWVCNKHLSAQKHYKRLSSVN